MWIMNATEYDGLTGESPQKVKKCTFVVLPTEKPFGSAT